MFHKVKNIPLFSYYYVYFWLLQIWLKMWYLWYLCLKNVLWNVLINPLGQFVISFKKGSPNPFLPYFDTQHAIHFQTIFDAPNFGCNVLGLGGITQDEVYFWWLNLSTFTCENIEKVFFYMVKYSQIYRPSYRGVHGRGVP